MRVLVAFAVAVGLVAALMALGGNGWAEMSASRHTCDQATLTNTSTDTLFVHYGPKGSNLPPLQIGPGEVIGLAGVRAADLTVTDPQGNELSPDDARTRLVTECASSDPNSAPTPGPTFKNQPASWGGLSKTGK
ncbi:hypothetical protein AADG42_09305 [Ammonicoccus fulvus]|uniref:Uncharacterized protein n=1 Tax=Ammonicoccus fulvus TaxID=3138240 RepID=A0ABZ3FN68_9ACTN